MHKLSVFFFILFAIVLTSGTSFAQSSDDAHVVHFQSFKMKSMPMGEDGKAFQEMMLKQAKVINSDSRVVSSYILRHYWGNDSRDLVMVTEFKNSSDLFAFYDEMNDLMEKAMPKEELEKGNALWNKYVGEHSDEIYMDVPGARK